MTGKIFICIAGIIITGILMFAATEGHCLFGLDSKGPEDGDAIFWFSDSLKGDGADDIVWRLSYYYKDPGKHELKRLHEYLLGQKKLIKDPKYCDFIFGFFPAALHKNKGWIHEFRFAGDGYSDVQKKAAGEIMSSAEHFASVVPDSPERINLLWVEFMATGDPAPVRKIINVLSLPDTQSNRPLLKAAAMSLLVNIPKHYDIKDALKSESVSAKGEFKTILDKMLALIDALAEQAKTHVNKGMNYAKSKEYDKALLEYESVLKVFPYYPSVYSNMANVYEEKGDKDKAFELVKKAAGLTSGEPAIFYNLGRHYFMRGNYDDAIKNYAKALEYEPQKPNYNHAIARAYQMKGDVKNAAVYFKKYLQHAPDGEHAALVKQYLSSINIAVNEDPSDVIVMLQKKEYRRLEAYLVSLLKDRKKDSNGHSLLYAAFERLTGIPKTGNISASLLARLEAWVKFDGDSHFSNASLGLFYIKYAWEARGSGWTGSVTENGRELFGKRLELAREHLELAYRRDRSDPVVPARLITAARGLGLDKEEMEIQFSRAITADKTEFLPYREKLLYLMPKWHGSEEEMFSFAREAAKSAPPNSIAPQVLAQAHWEMYSRSKNDSYFKDPQVYNEIKKVYRKLLTYFPDSNEIHNWLAITASLAEDFETANREFKIIGDDWLDSCWGNYQYFQRMRDYAAANYLRSAASKSSSKR